jgi:hypothetical protein
MWYPLQYIQCSGAGSLLRGFPSIEGVSLRVYPSAVAFHIQAEVGSQRAYPSTVRVGSLRGFPSIEGVSLRDH